MLKLPRRNRTPLHPSIHTVTHTASPSRTRTAPPSPPRQSTRATIRLWRRRGRITRRLLRMLLPRVPAAQSRRPSKRPVRHTRRSTKRLTKRNTVPTKRRAQAIDASPSLKDEEGQEHDTFCTGPWHVAPTSTCLGWSFQGFLMTRPAEPMQPIELIDMDAFRDCSFLHTCPLGFQLFFFLWPFRGPRRFVNCVATAQHRPGPSPTL